MKRLLLLLLLLAACGGAAPKSAPPAACHAKGQLPDPRCTPGAYNSAVTQATISKTICVPGWTATVRPPVSYTNRLKTQQILMYGYRDKNLQDYEEDHLIPLEVGGSPRSAANLWPEPHPGSSTKDKIENRLHTQVCDHTVTLAKARREIATNWTTLK